MMKDSEAKSSIREVIEAWVIYRDSALWDRFRTVWHPDAIMMATWFQGTAEEFIRVSEAGVKKGVNIHHFLGGSAIEVSGDRAVAQTKMQILQRAEVEGVEVDVTCLGRFHDFFAYLDGRWAMAVRRLTYELDWINPVDPAARLALDPEKLATWPPGYRHLAYLQDGLGFPVKPDMPGVTGPATEQLYDQEQRWLDGVRHEELVQELGIGDPRS